MIEDMKLSGLSARTQQVYIDGVRGLAAHYKRSPDLLTEEEVWIGARRDPQSAPKWDSGRRPGF
jgi:hypothetical protein